MRLFSKLRRIAARSSSLVIGVGASIPSRIGSLMGDFTLPVTATWNRRILPAGEYRFAVSPLMSRPWVYVSGDGEAAVLHVRSKQWAAGAPDGLLCLLYDDSGYRVRSLKLPGGTEILYFESRPPVPAWGEAPGWRTVSSPHEAPGRPGVLYIPLRPDGPAWRHRGGRGVRFEDNTRLFLPAPRFANSQRTWVTGVATSVSRTVPASEGRDSEVR